MVPAWTRTAFVFVRGLIVLRVVAPFAVNFETKICAWRKCSGSRWMGGRTAPREDRLRILSVCCENGIQSVTAFVMPRQYCWIGICVERGNLTYANGVGLIRANPILSLIHISE